MCCGCWCLCLIPFRIAKFLILLFPRIGLQFYLFLSSMLRPIFAMGCCMSKKVFNDHKRNQSQCRNYQEERRERPSGFMSYWCNIIFSSKKQVPKSTKSSRPPQQSLSRQNSNVVRNSTKKDFIRPPLSSNIVPKYDKYGKVIESPTLPSNFSSGNRGLLPIVHNTSNTQTGDSIGPRQTDVRQSRKDYIKEPASGIFRKVNGGNSYLDSQNRNFSGEHENLVNLQSGQENNSYHSNEGSTLSPITSHHADVHSKMGKSSFEDTTVLASGEDGSYNHLPRTNESSKSTPIIIHQPGGNSRKSSRMKVEGSNVSVSYAKESHQLASGTNECSSVSPHRTDVGNVDNSKIQKSFLEDLTGSGSHANKYQHQQCDTSEITPNSYNQRGADWRDYNHNPYQHSSGTIESSKSAPKSFHQTGDDSRKLYQHSSGISEGSRSVPKYFHLTGHSRNIKLILPLEDSTVNDIFIKRIHEKEASKNTSLNEKERFQLDQAKLNNNDFEVKEAHPNDRLKSAEICELEIGGFQIDSTRDMPNELSTKTYESGKIESETKVIVEVQAQVECEKPTVVLTENFLEKNREAENIVTTPVPEIQKESPKKLILDLKSKLQQHYSNKYVYDFRTKKYSYSFDIRTLQGDVVHQQFLTTTDLMVPKSINKILVFGRPGYGKTSLCRTLSLEWARAKPESLDEEKIKNDFVLQEYKICIFYNLCNLKKTPSTEVEKKILDWVKHVVSKDSESFDELLAAWKVYMKKTVLILDGYQCLEDNLKKHVKIFLKNTEAFQNASVILTANPTRGEDDLATIFPRVADICGFSLETLATALGKCNSSNRDFDELVRNSKAIYMEGCSPLITNLIAEILINGLPSDSLYTLTDTLVSLLIKRVTCDSRVTAQEIDSVLLEIGSLLSTKRKEACNTFRIDQLPIIAKQHMKHVFRLEIVHKVQGNPTIIVIAHPVFASYLAVRWLRHKWSTKGLQRTIFLKNTIDVKSCSEEIVLDPENPEKIYHLGVIPQIVLEKNANQLENSLFQMSQDVSSCGIISAFHTRSLLLRIDEKLLPAYGINKLEINAAELFFPDIVSYLDFSYPIDYAFFRVKKEMKIHMKFCVTDDDDEAILFGVVSRIPSPVVEDGDLVDNCTEIFLDFSFLEMRKTYHLLHAILSNSFDECFLSDSISDAPDAQFVYDVLQTVLGCRKERYTQMCLSSSSVKVPSLLTWEVLSHAHREPTASFVLTMPNEVSHVKRYKDTRNLKDVAGKTRIINMINSFLDEAVDPSLTISLRSAFVSKPE